MENKINNKLFEHRPISELMAIVRQDFSDLNEKGLIDEGTIIKTVQWCNDKLGITIREIREICVSVDEFKAKIPLDFEKLYFVGGVHVTNSSMLKMKDPFNNNFDRDIIYEANLDRGKFGNESSYNVTINRIKNVTVHSIDTLVPINVVNNSHMYCHEACPNIKKKGKYPVEIRNGYIETPFRSGELYIIYLATMKDENGEILFPFHPMITPWYEWVIKEKIILDSIFNSDLDKGDADYMLKLARQEKVKAWLDAFNITTERGFGEYIDSQRKKELSWYNTYFKYFK